jgi:hypothetical protein
MMNTRSHCAKQMPLEPISGCWNRFGIPRQPRRQAAGTGIFLPDVAAGDGEPMGVARGRVAAPALSEPLGNEHPPYGERHRPDSARQLAPALRYGIPIPRSATQNCWSALGDDT